MEQLSVNRQWLLARRPQGAARREDFRLVEQPLPTQPLAAGEIEVRATLFQCAPTMRNWMAGPDPANLYPSVPLDAPMLALAGGRITASHDPDWPVGRDVTWFGSWQEVHRLQPAAAGAALVPAGISLVEAVGRFGLNALTAYFGLLRIGRPQSGETLLVSGAAGSVGATVVQIGRLSGCRVVGIAGGARKCGWLRSELGVEAVDYRSGPLGPAIAAACPDGVDVFFDNVGGATLDAAVDHLNKFGRVVLCGQIAGYDGATATGPRNMMRLIYGSVRMQGFLTSDFAAEFPDAVAALRRWSKRGELIHRDDIRDGFERLPETLLDLFASGNDGTLMVMTDRSATTAA